MKISKPNENKIKLVKIFYQEEELSPPFKNNFYPFIVFQLVHLNLMIVPQQLGILPDER
ncbi:MAG: hypothetical protein IT219_01015 [Bacteroidales bacterium]|nr:hypothetical protein [Bacteroidales bacterium]